MTGRNRDWDRFLSQSLSDSFRTGFAAAYTGQSVCVAGAGVDSGSALVRTLAHAELRSLILLDSSEYCLFKIQRWMETEAVGVSCHCVLGSVGDERLLDSVFTRFGPQTVFHAAAFKHVGLLERNPFAAIANNALGSYSL